MNRDRVFKDFLQAQFDSARKLNAASDTVDLMTTITPCVPIFGPLTSVDSYQGEPPSRYVANFHCRGLARNRSGEIRVGDCWSAGITFPEDYLVSADPFRVLTWRGVEYAWHPNISNTQPVGGICIGPIQPGTGLVELVQRMHEVITWRNVGSDPTDCLNEQALEWAREQWDGQPVDPRPFRRRVSSGENRMTCRASEVRP